MEGRLKTIDGWAATVWSVVSRGQPGDRERDGGRSYEVREREGGRSYEVREREGGRSYEDREREKGEGVMK